jgi:hypothetical protein
MSIWLVWRPDSSFFKFLQGVDLDLTRKLQQSGCPHCEGRLDRADYPRKPRGDLEQAGETMEVRFSLCCAREGCRRRLTPPSLRFLGRKVYYGAWILVACAVWLCGEILGSRIRSVPRRTIRRWLGFWSDDFTGTKLWRVGRARFLPPVDETRLPLSLLERFVGEPSERLLSALAFVRPMTTISAPAAMAY